MPTSRVLSFPEPSAARFELKCWGEFSLFDRLQQDDGSPRGRKARAIIAYLASQSGAFVSRERLAGLLWSERGDQQARASLRQTLLELKPYATDGARLLVIEHDHVHLNMPLLTSDIARMETLARADDIEALAQALSERGDRLYGGLDGVDPALDEWLALERGVQQDRLLSLGAAAAERGLQRGEYESTSRLATQLQALDETNEAIAQIGMRADQACGDRSAARRRHRRLSEALRRELGVKPSPETDALLEGLAGSPGLATFPAAPVAEPAPLAADPTATPEEPATPGLDQAGPARDGAGRGVKPWVSGRLPAVALLALLAAAGGAAWLFRDALPGAAGPGPRVAIAPFVALEADPAARDFSARLSDQVAGTLKDNVVGLPLANPRAPGAATLRLGGKVSRDDGSWRVRAVLEDPRRNVTLWTKEFRRPAQQEAALETEVAVASAEIVDDAVAALEEKAARRDPQALALYLQASSALKSPALMNMGEPRRLLEDAVVRAPHFVNARATLALALFSQAALGPAPDRPQMAQRVRTEAERAIRSAPAAAGAAYDALYMMTRLTRPGDLAAAEKVLIDGQAKAPHFPYLPMRRCQFLTETGLARDALGYCQRALALRPLASPPAAYYASALYASGSPQMATLAADRALRLHPEHIDTRVVQFDISAFNGSPDAALAMLHAASDAAPCNCFTPEGVVALDLFLKARKSQAPADADSAVAALTEAARKGRLPPRYAVFGAAALGHVDEAFAMLEMIAKLPGPGEGLAGILLDGPAEPLWRDRRFWPLAAQAGYVTYWRTRGVLPDFCSLPTLPYDCRTEMARVAGLKPVGAR